MIAQKCNQWSGFSIEKAQFIDPVSIARYNDEQFLKTGDLLWNSTGLGTLGRMAIYEELLNPYGMAVADSHVTVIRFVGSFSTPEFFFDYFASPVVQTNIADKADGSTKQKELATSTVINYLVPIPPLEEQRRIATKVDELMPKVADYEKIEKQLIEFEARFPTDLKKAIFQSAVEGKLVPQDPDDEPVEKLLESIADERKSLIKAGKLKREKCESVIFRGSDRLTYETRDGETVCIEDELPFKIPEGWAWVRLGSIATIIRGSGIKRDEIVPDGMPCIRYGELYTTYRTRIDAVISHTTESVASRAKSIKRGDVILTLTGENKEDIGMAAAYLGDDNAVVGGDVAILKDHHCDPLWLSYFLAAPFAVGQKANMSNGDIIVHLSAQSVARIMVPLPPLAEQKRIVTQIEMMQMAIATLTT